MFKFELLMVSIPLLDNNNSSLSSESSEFESVSVSESDIKSSLLLLFCVSLISLISLFNLFIWFKISFSSSLLSSNLFLVLLSVYLELLNSSDILLLIEFS